MAKCSTCGGHRRIKDAPPPQGFGCYITCPACNGTGTAPDATNCGNCYRCLDGANDHRGWPVLGTRMIVCPDCGNKRCPKATDCRLDCTGSNEPGQPGSRYGTAPDATAPAGTPEAQYNELTAIATGRLPAPATAPALAATVAMLAKMAKWDYRPGTAEHTAISQAAALLTQQAEQLQQLTAALERIANGKGQYSFTGLIEQATAALRAALAALEVNP